MRSPLDAASSIVFSAILKKHSRCSRSPIQMKAQQIGRELFAEGLLTIIELEELPGMEKSIRCRFDYDDGNGLTFLTLIIRDELAYRVLRARETSSRLFIAVQLQLHLDSDNAWNVSRLTVLDR